jgi:hypothetical protein
MTFRIRTVAFITLYLICVLTSLAGYTTPNSGVVWTLDSLVARSGGVVTGSFPNYALTDTVTVAPNDRVSIRAGSIVTVSQGSGLGFTVLGVLRAVGTSTDSIIVKGAVATAGSHRGFRFEDSSVDSLCLISYCRIQDATEAVHCLNSNPTITNTLFTNNSSNGVRCFAASPIIRNCLFIENRQSAITANLGSSPIIENNLLVRNNSQNTSARNQIAVGAQGVNNPVIRNNEIYNLSYFRAGAISLANIETAGGCAAVVEGNYLHDNSYGILSQGPNMTPILRYNRIENNRINPDPLVSGSGISVQTGGPTNAPIITGNIFKGNYWGITIVSASGLTSSPQPNVGNLSNADTSDDGWNIFINNNNGGTIYQLYNNGTMDVSAQNNYWGSTDSVIVESWITHHPDSSVFGTVNYRPYGRPGLGRPDSFTVRQISGTQVRLRWSFAVHTPYAGVRILVGTDSLNMALVTTLPDTQTSYVLNFPTNTRHYYGLSSFNRFGEGDTTKREFIPILPGVREPSGTPREFRLNQNYPNPFNPSTTIGYALPRESFVKIEVLDVLGQLVERLVEGNRPAGNHYIVWNPAGRPSGVYFCKLAADGFVSVKSMMLMK